MNKQKKKMIGKLKNVLLSPKAALQLKCIFAVYELNLINNFCIVAKTLFVILAYFDCQQKV